MSKQVWLPAVAAVMVMIPLCLVTLATDWGPQGSPLHFSHIVGIGLGILIVGHLLFHPQPEADKALEEVRQRQAQQASHWEDLTEILPHLLPESQRAHLLRLQKQAAEPCQGTRALRGDLRRLCAMGLVRPKLGRRIRQIADGAAVDLADYVELTPLGTDWVRSLLVIEKAERPAAGRSDEVDPSRG
jgi:hypothetical protein